MANVNDFLTTSEEHPVSGIYRFANAIVAIPVGTTVPSGIQNQIIFIEPSGVLCIFDAGSWKVKSPL